MVSVRRGVVVRAREGLVVRERGGLVVGVINLPVRNEARVWFDYTYIHKYIYCLSSYQHSYTK